MNKLLIAIALVLASCAPNPLGLTEGMWVRHRIDGQKYYITDLRTDIDGNAGRVRVKNEFGVEIEKKLSHS